MAGSLMDVFVKIGADTSDLETGINKTKGLASGLGSTLGSAVFAGVKVAGAALATATTAAGAFAAKSVEVGKTFDSSMSQVAATMGKTTDEIGELRDFAQQMGASTAFSATQAADALNYMALAGYDADQAMEMLPNVLNLAAAGNMALAAASDMVTDAQSALSLSAEEATQMVDMMAKTSSKSNTSVSQLGDAILTVGGTAKTLAGGTTELNASLGILADNGIKGAEGGTKLRNVILSLSAPTDTAAKKLNELGVSTVDANGDLKSLDQIMGDLNKSLEGMGTAEKADVISTIFNKQDIAAVNALLDTSQERWDELTDSIENSTGAAEAMAKTQLDNLAGDITLFKSALEGAQILISDALTPSLREFVQFGTEGISKISDGFKEGGLSGAMDAFGEVLSQGISKVTEMIPEFIDAGMRLLGAIGQGIIDNLPVLIDASVKIINQLATGLIEALPQIATGAVEILTGLANGIAENLPTLIPMAVDMVLEIANGLIDNVDKLVDGAIALVVGLAEGLINAMPKLIEKVPELIAKLVTALINNAPKLLEAGVAIINALINGFNQAFPQASSAIDGFVSGVKSAFDSIVSWLSPLVESFKNYFTAIKDALTAIISAITGVVTSFISSHQSQIDAFISAFKSVISTGLEFVAGLFKTQFTAIRDTIKTVLDVISNLVKAFTSVLKGDWSGALNYLKSAAQSGIDGVKNIFNNLKSNLQGVFSGLISSMSSWGSDMIQGLVNGITSKISAVTSAVSNVASSIKSFLHFSEPDVGPLSDFSTYAPDMMKLFAKGIADNTDIVTDQINKSFDFGDQIVGTAEGEGQAVAGASNSVVINVYGAEGQDINSLAQIVADKVNFATQQQIMAWG